MRVKLLSVLAAAVLTACGGGLESPVAQIEQQATEVAEAITEPAVEVLGTVTNTAYYQTPAMIRTRYGFDALPNTPEGQGSGQLIAIISSYNNPVAAESLEKFSEKFGINKCKTVPTTYVKGPGGHTEVEYTKPAVGQQCTFQVINNYMTHANPTGAKGFTNDPTWTMESTMDIEWAHAMAPQASIVLVQVPSPFPSALSFGAQYASQVLKADVVSMSFGAAEKSMQCSRRAGSITKANPDGVKHNPACDDNATMRKYWSNFAQYFSNPNTTFVAASGDAAITNWPAINPSILAVGGTALNNLVWNKSDYGWKYSGGGLAPSFDATPAQRAVTGQVLRATPDVAYDAGTPVAIYIKPTTVFNRGAYPNQLADTACVKANSEANCGWYGGTGTSAGAPQWAGLVAVANAMRKAQYMPGTNYIDKMYTDVAINPAAYTSSFADVTTGNTQFNMSKTGFDLVTGLGVPHAATLVSYLVK